MAQERIERRLAAILAVDVAGYSRLMGADEEGTLAALKAHRREVADPTIADHGGHIIKTTGDGMLVEFPSVVNALRCAVEIQLAMAARNADVAKERRIELRAGINVGDIIPDGGDIFGDGVNVAARLEGLAEPGGICVSGRVQEDVLGKLDFCFEDIGEQQLKNIARPVRVFRIKPAASAAAPAAGRPESRPAVPAADKPSMAVLPFQNMSGDLEQDYFADGVVEDIITALSRVKWFFVVARNSSFIYKGKAVDIKQVGRELNVRYVLEGSVRKAGNRVRITGQLIEASTGHHIWADRFEGSLEDIFALQDRVTESVVGAIEPSLMKAEMLRGRSKPTESLDAYDCYLRALAAFHEATPAGYDAAEAFLQKAIDLEPHYATAKAWLAYTLVKRRAQGWSRPGDAAKAVRLARESVAAGSDDPMALGRAGLALTYFGADYDLAVTLADRALDINPNSAQVLAPSAWVHCFNCADPDKAIDQFNRAIRLSPRDPELASILSGLAFASLVAGRNQGALQYAQKALHELPNITIAHRAQILALTRMNRMDEARETARRMVEADPAFTITTRLPPYRDIMFRTELHNALKGLGLPE